MQHTCYCVTAHNQPLERMDVTTPEPKGAEVLIRMTGAGVCHSDIHLWEGVYDLGAGNKMTLKDRGVTLPLTMGHEISGEVVKAGPEAKIAAGTSCVVYPWLGCGECPTCKRGDENLCTIKTRSMGVFSAGGYAEFVLVPHERYCVALGKLDPAEAAPLACSGVTTYSALKKFGPKIKDEPVVIMGGGGLGHMALTVLRAMQGKGAIVVDIDAEKRKAALEAGALAAIDGAAADAAKQIMEAAGRRRIQRARSRRLIRHHRSWYRQPEEGRRNRRGRSVRGRVEAADRLFSSTRDGYSRFVRRQPARTQGTGGPGPGGIAQARQDHATQTR